MKKIGNIALGIWCFICCLVSPIWLTIVILNLSGMIYQYDYSMDRGTAGIIGIILLLFWIIIVLIPDIYFLKALKMRIIRFMLLVLIIVGCLPIYFSYSDFVARFFGDGGYMHVETITEQTYEQLIKADDMFTELPYNSQVTEVYVKYAFDGDAYLNIYLETPEKYVEDFKDWLDISEEKEQYSQEGNIFNFWYFDSSNSYHFDNLVSNPLEIVFSKVYWGMVGVLIIALLIPYEKLYDGEKSL